MLIKNHKILIVREYKKDVVDSIFPLIVNFFRANWLKEWKDFIVNIKEWEIRNKITWTKIMAEWARWSLLDAKIRWKEFYMA